MVLSTIGRKPVTVPVRGNISMRGKGPVAGAEGEDELVVDDRVRTDLRGGIDCLRL